MNLISVGGSGSPNKVFVQQADAAISQANPVSTTLYEVLATTKNVRVLSLFAKVTWAVNQPTPLEAVVTIDGQTISYGIDNPVSATNYFACAYGAGAEANQSLNVNDHSADRAFILEGRSVRIQARITFAAGAPTPLVCRVKYARIP